MKLLAILCALLALPTQASWYQVTGQASLDQDNARQHAIDDALAQARFYGGLRDDEGQSGSAVRQSQLVSEREEGGQQKVTLLVELDDSPGRQCWQRQPISLHRFSWASPDQAISGLVGDPGQGIAMEAARLLRERQGALVPVGDIGATLDQPQAKDNNNLQLVAERQGARWLLGGRLVRLRDQLQAASWYNPWGQDKHQLTLAMDAWLIDSFSGKRIFERRYLADAELSTSTLLDTQDPSFWLSPFGQKLQRSLQEMVQDVEAALPCQASQWPILSVSSDGLLIDAGLKAGLGPDDSFTVLQKRTLLTATGERRQVLVPSETELHISWQSDNQSLLKAEGATQNGNIQPGDFVLKTLN
ncbi:flagella assembly protein FlgT middle domain-containing protein [Gallaecimonas kandeliae]|uniref:flagellar assembly protein T N-terminal domain-containing protein n=1 Tax=Gallaecimonas kandeliae TaxID=3029055 RepID=UPI00264A3469|nr:flagella assembly protein FlgT middle domain-containing protein [Gallaecimonas kandeliae]WKE66699.1 flagella assembly protein FlgT middle domain-containing protein [Gallaecimonas kandeliae]